MCIFGIRLYMDTYIYLHNVVDVYLVWCVEAYVYVYLHSRGCNSFFLLLFGVFDLYKIERKKRNEELIHSGKTNQ